jgi:hypothetical protein
LSNSLQRRRPARTALSQALAGSTSRRVLLEVFLGFGATAAVLYASLDGTAWTAYEAVEEAWIRDRHELLLEQAPACVQAARIDLELRLADLQRRGMQFRQMLNRDPTLLRGGIWQLTALPVSDDDNLEMMGASQDYRRQCDRVRQLGEALRRHPQYDVLRRAQVRLWKTPQYREAHRRYTGRMQELQQNYGSGPAGDAAVSGGAR